MADVKTGKFKDDQQRVSIVVYEGDLFLKPDGNKSMTSHSIIAIETMRPDIQHTLPFNQYDFMLTNVNILSGTGKVVSGNVPRECPGLQCPVLLRAKSVVP